MYVCIYIYIHTHVLVYAYSAASSQGPPPSELNDERSDPRRAWVPRKGGHTPSPPRESFPTKSPRVELSGRLPIQFNGLDNFHPLELRVCLSQTLRNPNS